MIQSTLFQEAASTGEVPSEDSNETENDGDVDEKDDDYEFENIDDGRKIFRINNTSNLLIQNIYMISL